MTATVHCEQRKNDRVLQSNSVASTHFSSKLTQVMHRVISCVLTNLLRNNEVCLFHFIVFLHFLDVIVLE